MTYCVLFALTGDWSSEKKFPVYFTGETVHMEASVDHYRPSLRLYVGSCVATLTPDVNSHPRYPFIDHRGCFVDSLLSGSRSRFLPRVQDQLLHIQLQPFLFHEDHRHNMYITCYLEASVVSEEEPENRACSFIIFSSRWRSVDGDDDACESCSSTAEYGHKRAQRSQRGHAHETTVGPIVFLPDFHLENINNWRQTEDTKEVILLISNTKANLYLERTF
uniref:ZP domain-containing protein n=1 Tax=Oryzias melastigma TaxID=30732 RepID=A0A3B3C1H9_ORYME